MNSQENKVIEFIRKLTGGGVGIKALFFGPPQEDHYWNKSKRAYMRKYYVDKNTKYKYPVNGHKK